MTVAVFTGPSLCHADARAILPRAKVLPPAARGDIYRAACRGAKVIALIDGAFEMVPAVMHKEVLWVLSAGVHVYGAASMGALRAAELRDYGMVGVGRIYEDYASGRIDADDEVAVTMGPAELGFPALTEPLVNIRATLLTAVAERIIRQDTANTLVAIARSLFFKDRSFEALLERARPKHDLIALESWLPIGRVDQKRLDAIALLEQLAAEYRADPAPHRPCFDFVATSVWLQLKQRIDQELDLGQCAGGA